MSGALLERLLRREDLDARSAEGLLAALTAGTLAPALAGALLAALRAKGETGAELAGLARAMRRLARDPGLDATTALDIVGTGGDGSGSLNLSTGAALLAAACGARVIKHGNRAQTSRSGSADVLEALGYELPADGRAARVDLDRAGFTFLHAPHFHPALAPLAGVRRALGVRTVLNLVGPLANPAAPPFAVIGACDPAVAVRMAEALSALPIERAFVVHGAHGWDEPTPCGPFLRLDVRAGRVERREIDPASVGLARCDPGELLGGEARENARRLREAFVAPHGAHATALALGAGLGLEAAGRARSLAEGVDQALGVLGSGAAARWLVRFLGAPDAEQADA